MSAPAAAPPGVVFSFQAERAMTPQEGRSALVVGGAILVVFGLVGAYLLGTLASGGVVAATVNGQPRTFTRGDAGGWAFGAAMLGAAAVGALVARHGWTAPRRPGPRFTATPDALLVETRWREEAYPWGRFRDVELDPVRRIVRLHLKPELTSAPSHGGGGGRRLHVRHESVAMVGVPDAQGVADACRRLVEAAPQGLPVRLDVGGLVRLGR